jgi:hypothetical protein
MSSIVLHMRLSTSCIQAIIILAECTQVCRLGGVVVSVLAPLHKDPRFESGQRNGFLRAIKIRSTPSFGWEVKPEVPCRKVLWCVKEILKSHGDGYTKF